jgi:hypothetical protein
LRSRSWFTSAAARRADHGGPDGDRRAALRRAQPAGRAHCGPCEPEGDHGRRELPEPGGHDDHPGGAALGVLTVQHIYAVAVVTIALASTVAASALVLALAGLGRRDDPLPAAVDDRPDRHRQRDHLRQQVIPDALQSRVDVIARMIAIGGTPAGAIIGGLIAQAMHKITINWLPVWLPVRLANDHAKIAT